MEKERRKKSVTKIKTCLEHERTKRKWIVLFFLFSRRDKRKTRGRERKRDCFQAAPSAEMNTAQSEEMPMDGRPF